VITRVEVSRLAIKQLRKAPQHVAAKLEAWIDDVEDRGIEEVRKVPGYNDHPLKGELAGKRAIRLSLKWRAVYVIRPDEAAVQFVEVQEVHPHDY
jgi:proteic killer suppression protein